jgi:hypothetical protein
VISVERGMHRIAALLVAAMLVGAACTSAATNSGSPPSSSTSSPTTIASTSTVPVPTSVDEQGFDDHTVASVSSEAELLALARSGVGGQWVVKFVIPMFDRPTSVRPLPPIRLMDSNFYSLHDEWYWFRLLNGRPIPGADVDPVAGLQFDSIAAIYDWADLQPPDGLPLDLRWSTHSGDRRLYSSDFYDLILHGSPRRYAAGSLVRMPDADGTGASWLIELEYSDSATPADVATIFERLQPALPDRVADQLRWVLRSPAHEATAAQMAAKRLPFHDRVVRYADLVPPGSVAVYSEGVTAGRLLYVGEDGADLATATATDIIVTEHVPDALPPAAGLLTSDLQTPLAHVNLLARNRGIPNASIVGLHADPGVRQAARVRAFAAVLADGDDVWVVLLTEQQYRDWQEQSRPLPVVLPPVDVVDAPLVIDLTTTAAEVDDPTSLVSLIGGKSVGMLTLLITPGLAPPPNPVAITVRPYLEHLDPLRPTLAALITDPAFTDSSRARLLLLEGRERFGEQLDSEADTRWADEFVAAHPVGTAVGDVLAADGVMRMIESRPIDPPTLAAITDELAFTYRDLAVTQGLRFRSSSNVEDIDGFSGAGLYSSHTGYLRPDLQDEDDQDNTIERAILRTWASYWGFEGFEERELANIDHLSGAMAITVHARFDDDLELNNGVATITIDTATSTTTIDVNVQHGSVSVTNPDPTSPSSPEVLRLTATGDESFTLQRISPSTLEGGAVVLDDGAAAELAGQLAAIAGTWLATRATSGVVVLDTEFKTVDEGWPARSSGDPLPSRLVIRQVRSLAAPAPTAAEEALRALVTSGEVTAIVAPGA